MKKTFKFLAGLTLLVTALAFTSCMFDPTFGMQKLDPADVTTDWVTGTWSGTATATAYSKDGKQTSKSENNAEFDCSNSLAAGAMVLLLKAYAYDGNLYANSARTKVVYHVKDYYDSDKTQLRSQVTYTLKKTN